jgi:hypothetical protein
VARVRELRCVICLVEKGTTARHTTFSCATTQAQCWGCLQHRDRNFCDLVRDLPPRSGICRVCLLPKVQNGIVLHTEETYATSTCRNESFRLFLLTVYKLKPFLISAFCNRTFTSVQFFYNYIASPENSVPLFLHLLKKV